MSMLMSMVTTSTMGATMTGMDCYCLPDHDHVDDDACDGDDDDDDVAVLDCPLFRKQKLRWE